MLAADRFVRSGKVRDISRLSDGRLVLVASDRISAFDVVLPTPIPDKGRVLTAMSRFWFRETASLVPNHLLGTDPVSLAPVSDDVESLRGRVMICREARVVPVEAVVRGYLAGSGWKEYQESGTVCGIPLPPGLRESDQLPQPIFTPATKAPQGEHDENVSFDAMIEHLARWWPSADAGPLAEAIRDQAIRLYRFGAAVTARRGVLLADTKLEFGMIDGPSQRYLTLIDEVMTPDSSRFWEAASYEPGRTEDSYDKQFVRDWLETQSWDKRPPGPELPDDVVAGTRARYIEAFERITGASFDRYLEEDVIAR
jgi:phosphoribosylaminoimidazole-succinocarboxamide synthase